MTPTLEAHIGIGIGDLDQLGDKIVDRVNGHRKAKPFYLTRSAALIGTGKIITLDLGTPPTGSIWNVRGIALFGNDDHSAIASGITCSLYVGNASSLTLAGLRVPNMPIPFAQYVSPWALMCHPTENLIVLTSGIALAGQQVGANISVEEWREHDISRSIGA